MRDIGHLILSPTYEKSAGSFRNPAMWITMSGEKPTPAATLLSLC
jgi:hypothetical protein